MPDIARLLWPRSVAVIGASSKTEGLRGRILQVMKSHAFAGAIYPVSRSENTVQGLPAFRSITELPEVPDLAVIIIPAKYVPQELERCGAAGVKAAIVLSSGFAEEGTPAGRALQNEVREIAGRYDIALSGPNGEGFANTAAALCPTFSPAMEAHTTPLLPEVGRSRGQVAVVSQSGGMGFAFFDHGRPKNLSFRYIVTTGNAACLDTFDFVDYMLDEGKTDVFLLLIEDVKDAAKFERVAAKALCAGKPLIVAKLGQSEAGRRAVAAHTAAQAGSHAELADVFARYGIVEAEDPDGMIDMAAGFLAFGSRLPVGKRVGICTSSGGGGAWVADACAAAGLEMPVLDSETRAAIDVNIPAYGTSQNPVDVTAQGVYARGYAEFARMLAGSPAVDGLIVVVTARYPRLLLRDAEALKALARGSAKPILFWTYTRPAQECVELMSEAGFPLFINVRNCARTFRAMADYHQARERFLQTSSD